MLKLGRQILELGSAIVERLNSTKKPNLQTCRRLSLTRALFATNPPKNDEPAKELTKINCVVLYHMEEIYLLNIMSDLELYLGLLSVIFIPTACVGELLKVAPNTLPLHTVAISYSIVGFLSLFSAVVKDTIGIIYICPANLNIRIAYLDFWGYRKHYDTTVDNIVVHDGKGFRGLYQLVKLRDGAKTFKLYTRRGVIYDFDMYERLFGRLKK